MFWYARAEPFDTKICPEEPTEDSPVPPLAVDIAVAFHIPVVIVPIVAKFGIEVILLCAAPITVVACVAVPSKFAAIVPAVPLNTLLVSVASGIKVNLPALSSKPKKPVFAPPSTPFKFNTSV